LQAGRQQQPKKETASIKLQAGRQQQPKNETASIKLQAGTPATTQE
jgi:hypothetical protein